MKEFYEMKERINLIIRSIVDIVGHILICIKLGTILSYLVIRGSYTWIYMLSRLLAYSTLLLPGWIHLLSYWFFSPNVKRGIEYGMGAYQRNVLDLYIPQYSSPDKPCQVIVFFGGGAWIIGYKLWSCFVGRALSKLGFIVVVPDYRNFPQGSIDDMIMDVRRAFEWTLRNIDKYNGSPNRIILAGQSAGAHITLCALVQAFEDELKDNRMKAQLDEATKKLNTSIRVPKKNDSDNDDGTPSSEKSEPITPKYDEFYRRTHAISQSPIPPPIAIPLSALTSPPSNKSSMDMNEPSALTATDTQTIDTMTNKEFLDHTLMYVGISGPYNLEYLYAHFHKRGLDASILNYIFLERYHKYSPTKRFEDLTSTTTAIDDTMAALKRHGRERKLSSDILPPKISSEFDGRRDTLSNKLSSFPPVALFHGTTDKTIPSEVAAELARTLHSGGASVWLTEYEGWSHTDPILEGPMCGDNALFHDIKSCVDQITSRSTESIAAFPYSEGAAIGILKKASVEGVDDHIGGPLVSRFLVSMARIVNPF